MAKKKDLNLLDYSAYISDDGLDKLKILEGHTKTEEVMNKETGKKEVTGLYGIKESAIKEVKRYAKEKGYDITEAMSKVKTPWDLTEETARDFAGYYAWRNHERADELTNNQFSQLTQHQKDVFLTYFHNMSLEKLSKNKGQKGSMLDALENGDTDEAIKRIFMKADGTISKYEDYIEKDRRGVANRNIATAEWLYNPNTLALQSAAERDKHYRDIYPNEDRIGTIVHGVGLMQDFKRQQRGEDMSSPDMWDSEEEWYTPLIEQNATRNATLLDAAYEIGRRIGNYIKGKTDAGSNQLANSQTNMLNSENGFEYRGNIDLSNRPKVKNKDGSISTVRSISYNRDGKEVLIPTVSDEGKILSDKDAISYWENKGQNLGVYDTVEDANYAAEQIHKQQEAMISK